MNIFGAEGNMTEAEMIGIIYWWITARGPPGGRVRSSGGRYTRGRVRRCWR